MIRAVAAPVTSFIDTTRPELRPLREKERSFFPGAVPS
jgi:hypothetical protein